MKPFYILALLIGLTQSIYAQRGTITGKVTEQDGGAPIYGAIIRAKDAPIGASSDEDGNYKLELPVGTYTILIESFGYKTQEFPTIEIKDGAVVKINAPLGFEEKEMEEVIIHAKKEEVAKESIESMINLQKKTASNISTISSEEMKKLPDRSSGEVLKRVSGTSIQDGKYITIRGLNERYNMTMINGVVTPSTETDRKAFSYDIIPANLLDNIVVYKTATPDLPADFAGGVVQITTKDIPEEKRNYLSLGSGINNRTTFKTFYIENGSKTDALGFDNKFRVLPNGIPSNNEDAGSLTSAQGAEQTKLWHHDFSSRKVSSMRPSLNGTYSFSNKYKIGKKPFGLLLGLNYNNSPSYTPSVNNSLRKISSSSFIGDEGIYSTTNTYGIETLSGAILNLSYQPASWINLGIKNTLSSNSTQFVSMRESKRIDDPTTDAILIRERALFFSSNQMYSVQANADVELPKNIKWKNRFGTNLIDRKIPDYRKTIYRSTSSENENGETTQSPYSFYTSPSPNFAYNSGRFFQFMKEKNYFAATDITLFLYKDIVRFKTGAMLVTRDRDTDIRTFAYMWPVQYNPGAKPIEEILTDANFTSKKIKLIESESNYYDVTATTLASYGMLDIWFTSKLKLIGGIRHEKYTQSLSSINILPFTEVKKFNNYLPSAIAIYNLTSKMNLKLSYSQTVSRPEFREIAPVQFYDYLKNLITTGNPQLLPTKIYNYDFKWEYFFKPNEFISINPFYKNFKNPIETRLVPAEAPLLLYANIEQAKALGIELEYRWAFYKNFAVYGNVALIKSKINQNNSNNDYRSMQGQSPYVINNSFQYSNNKYHFNTSLTLNRIGTRIEMDGLYSEQILYEKARTMIDFQITKSITKRFTMQYILANLLAQNIIYFYDINSNKKYDPTDIQFNNFKMARRHSLNLTYVF